MSGTNLSEIIDPVMLDLFRAEVETHLPALSEGLLALEKDSSQTKRLEVLMRSAHSIKGAARVIGLDPAVRLAHVLEDSMVAAQAGKVTFTSDCIDVLLRGVDMLGRIAQGVGDGPEPTFPALVEQIEAIAQGGKPTPLARGPAPEMSLAVAGVMDSVAAEKLRQTLVGKFDEGESQFRLDLGQVTDIEPSGLALLVLFAGMARLRAGTTLEIAHASPDVRSLLRLTGLDRDYRLVAEPNALPTAAAR
jgi:two-component system sensor histidine kinase and response regulator WspE